MTAVIDLAIAALGLTVFALLAIFVVGVTDEIDRRDL